MESQHFQQSMDQINRGMVANLARGQLNREKQHFSLSPSVTGDMGRVSFIRCRPITGQCFRN